MAHGGDTHLDQTNIDDFVDGLLLVLDHASLPHGVYNISSGESPSLGTMVEIIKELIPGADLSKGDGYVWYTDKLQMPRKGALNLARSRSILGYVSKFGLRKGSLRISLVSTWLSIRGVRLSSELVERTNCIAIRRVQPRCAWRHLY